MRRFRLKNGVRIGLWTALVGMWLVFPFGQSLRFHLGIGLNVSLFDLLTGATSLLIFLTVWLTRRGELKPLFVWWLMVAAVWVISLWLSPLGLSKEEFTKSGLYWMRWLAGSSSIFLGAVLLPDERRRIVKMMLIASVGLAVSGLVQYVVFPYLGPLTSEGWDPHLYRVVGSFLDPGFSGFVFVGGLILLGLIKEQIGLGKGSWALVMAILFVGLLLTYSRASYLAFLAGFGLVALRRHKYRWYARLLAVFAVAVLLLPRPAGEGIRLERENSILARIENWSHTITIFRRNPLLGVGFDAYRYAQERVGYLREGDENHSGAGSDSSLFLVLATSGVVGASVFGWFVYRVVGIILNDNGIFGNVAISTLAALFVHFWFLNSLFYPWVLTWVGTIVGLTMAQTARDGKG